MKTRDHILLITGVALAIICHLGVSSDVDINGFLKGFSYGLVIYYLLKALFLKYLKDDKSINKIGLKNRDYVMMMAGFFLQFVGYIFIFKDQEISVFLRAMGLTLIAAFVIKSIYKFITRNEHDAQPN